MVSSVVQVEPVSRTDQYKRVMKPLLERKRRARINRCLDELRDLLVAAMQAEGETVTRLEKADILELTVRHVRRLNQRRRLTIPSAGAAIQDPRQDAVKFQQGFLAAAQQVQSFLLATPSLVEPAASSRLLVHLSSCASAINPTPLAPSPHQEDSPVDHRLQSSPSTSSSPVLTSPRDPVSVSPPHLMDLSFKGPQHQQQQPPPTSSAPRIHAPTPIRKEPVIVFNDSCGAPVPQDLSIRKDSPANGVNQEIKDAWRPW